MRTWKFTHHSFEVHIRDESREGALKKAHECERINRAGRSPCRCTGKLVEIDNKGDIMSTTEPTCAISVGDVIAFKNSISIINNALLDYYVEGQPVKITVSSTPLHPEAVKRIAHIFRRGGWGMSSKDNITFDFTNLADPTERGGPNDR